MKLTKLGKRVFKQEHFVKLNNSMQIYNAFRHEFIGLKQERMYILLFDRIDTRRKLCY